MNVIIKDNPDALVGAKIPLAVQEDLRLFLSDYGVDIAELETTVRDGFRHSISAQYRKAIKDKIGVSFRQIRELVGASDREMRRWIAKHSQIRFEFLFEAAAATHTVFDSSLFDRRPVFPKGQDVTINAVCDSVTMIRERIDGEKRWVCTPLEWAITHFARQYFWTKVAEKKNATFAEKDRCVCQLKVNVENIIGECPTLTFEEFSRIRAKWENPLKIFHWFINLNWVLQ